MFDLSEARLFFPDKHPSSQRSLFGRDRAAADESPTKRRRQSNTSQESPSSKRGAELEVTPEPSRDAD